MGKCLFLVLGWALSACAFGTADSSGDRQIKSGAADSGAVSSQSDSGSTPVIGGDDSGTVTPTDPPDAGNNNNDNNTSGCSYTGALATFDFTGEPGNQTSTAATSAAANLNAAAIARSTPLTATSGLNSINSSAWTTSASADPTRYYSLSLTPSSGCALDISSIAISTKSSSTGPTQGAIATSDDNFAKATQVTSNGTATAALSVSGATQAVEIRVYGFGASSAAGTMRIEGTLTVSGALH